MKSLIWLGLTIYSCYLFSICYAFLCYFFPILIWIGQVSFSILFQLFYYIFNHHELMLDHVTSNIWILQQYSFYFPSIFMRLLSHMLSISEYIAHFAWNSNDLFKKKIGEENKLTYSLFLSLRSFLENTELLLPFSCSELFFFENKPKAICDRKLMQIGTCMKN